MIIVTSITAYTNRHDVSQAIQRLIDKWALPWTYRFLGFMCLLFGTVSLSPRSTMISPSKPDIYYETQPAALLMKEGYLAKRSRRGSVTEVERSMFQSSRFIRILIACFVASYPFFIPPFVSHRTPLCEEDVMTDMRLYYSIYLSTVRIVTDHLAKRDTYTVLLAHAAQSVGFSASRGALYGALFNVSSGAGRIGFGMLADFATGVSTLCNVLGFWYLLSDS
jgi:hypothetical protein